MPHTITTSTVIIGCDVGKTFHQLHYMNPEFGVLGRRKIGKTAPKSMQRSSMPQRSANQS